MSRRQVVDDVLREMWRGLRDGADPADKRWVLGAICFAELTGAIPRDTAELWRRRIDECPGHDDEGGRSWCAYCGEMPDRAKGGAK